METENRRTLILVLILVSLTLFWFYKDYRRAKFPDPTDLVQESEIRSQTRKASPLSREPGKTLPLPLTQPSPDLQPKPTLTPKRDALRKISPTSLQRICQHDWQAIAYTNEIDLQRSLEAGRMILSRPCLQRMLSDLKVPPIQSFIKNCQLEISAKDLNYIQEACVPLLSNFRDFIIRQIGSNLIDYNLLSLADLAKQLMGGFRDLKTSTEEDLQKNIRLADAIIAQDPNAYSAYKAKLISLLIQELKFGASSDVDTYQRLYDELLTFQGTSREDQILTEAQALRGDELATAELTNIDSDLIHLPFLRLATQGDLEGLRTMAEEYIQAYPNSSIGYLYLADAAWKSGDRASAINIFKRTLGAEVSDEVVLEVLNRIESKKPLDLIMEMKL